MNTQYFQHLEQRCADLIEKFVGSDIAAEDSYHNAPSGVEVAAPNPDLDMMVALRLLVHAEFEGYFEAIAKAALNSVSSATAQTSYLAGLILLYFQKKEIAPQWTTVNVSEEKDRRAKERSDFLNYASKAQGFAREFIKNNNGIKESCIYSLAAIAGLYPDDISSLMITALNDYGKDRGAVAHDWHQRSSASNLESPRIERDRIFAIVNLIKTDFDPLIAARIPTTVAIVSPAASSQIIAQQPSTPEVQV